jgi:hypothetical protein
MCDDNASARRHAWSEGTEITEVQRTLAALDAGAVETVEGDEVIARFLAAGRITSASLAEAEERYGIPPVHRAR